MPESIVQETIQRVDRRKGDRSVFESHWQEIRDNTRPSAASFTSTDTPGSKNRTLILDNTGEQCSELLSAAVVAAETNPSEPWLILRALGYDEGTDHDAELWLEIAARVLLDVFNSPSANFAPQQHEKVQDLVDFGSGCLYIEERPGELPLFQHRPLQECLFSLGDDGRVDSNDRFFERTARQAAQRWGDKAGRRVTQAASDPKRQDEKFKFIHGVYPRRTRNLSMADAVNMAWASCWINVDEQHLIDESGFREFPYTCPRWLVRDGEIYGRGPGMKALPEVKMLQRVMKADIRGYEKVIDPALMVADDGVMGPVVLSSGGLNYVRQDLMEDGRTPIRPIVTGARPEIAEQKLEGIRGRIERAYLNHLITFARDPNMTATQFLGITEQTHKVFAPIISRLQVEDCQPMVTRTLGILLRMNPNNEQGVGLLPPIPQALMGKEIRVEYRSPITRLQKAGELKGLVQAYEIMAPIAAATGDTSVYDNYSPDQIARDVADITGMRKAWLRSTDEVAKLRKARMEAQAQQNQMDAAEQMADTAAAAGSGAKQFAEAFGGMKPANRMAA